ncbi:hypothetical protein FACHB389_10720 [Nostoc calcicola FACHB-389]|nr:hypothetical protein [Nostoc calcicola FACHB-3891]OKH36978.1 hypothetical protein FACHB389_10720 [Nostoc calcicola FACHB-389]
MKKFFRRNKVNIIFGIGFLGCIFISQDAIKANIQSANLVREKVQFNLNQENLLRASQQHSEAEATIAEQRYSNGCYLVDGDLVQGEPVYNQKTKKALVRGTIVCDRKGNTGKLIPRDFDRDGRLNAVVGEPAFTGNPPTFNKPTTDQNNQIVRYIR